MSIHRYFIEISYNGENYNGWQSQPNAPSIQHRLEDALSTILRSPITVTGAGRTDAGVHARGMMAHFDIDIPIPKDLNYRLNAFLPKDIAIKNIFSTKPDAHARFDALQRTYEYHLTSNKDVFLNHLTYYYPHSLDIESMNQAGKLLLSERHFKCFSKSKTDTKTDLCDVSQAYWFEKDRGFVFRITSDRFLRNMVRAIVGTLLEVGRHRIPVKQVKIILKSRDRSLSGFSVPAHGLYLVEIKYPSILFI